jgi:hypothetical protein
MVVILVFLSGLYRHRRRLGNFAEMAELADARDLKSLGPKARPGSIPGLGTIKTLLGPSGQTDAGWSSLVARWAHNPKVAGSNPAPATIVHHPLKKFKGVFCFRGPFGNHPSEVREKGAQWSACDPVDRIHEGPRLPGAIGTKDQEGPWKGRDGPVWIDRNPRGS